MYYRKLKSQTSCTKIRWQNLGLAYLLIINLLVGVLPSERTQAVSSCKDVEFIFARGSGEALSEPTYREGDKGTSYAAWRTEITQSLQDSTLNYEFYELGAKSYQGYQYPAVSVGDNLSGYINLLGAALSGGEAFKFGDSVKTGATELKLHLADVSQKCPKTKFVLGGYSQGAMLISKSLKDLDAEKIIYVATFGDPKLFLPEGDTGSSVRPKTPDACRGINLSNYRMYVPDCYAYTGVLGALIPYQDEHYIDKLGTWCNRSDIMCSSGLNVNDHTSYIADNLYRDAAQKIRAKLQQAFKDQVPVRKNNLHDVLFLFDATGSMQSTIDKYKAEAKKLAEKVIVGGGRAALRIYREWNGDSTTIEYCGFDCSIEALEKSIRAISPSGGGDKDEGLLAALDHAMRKVSWTQGATKSIVVLTDAGFHDPDRGNLTIADIVKLSLLIDPVNIYVIAPEEISDRFTELTQLTGGAFFDVNSKEEITLSTQVVYERPVALLNSPKFESVIGEQLQFDASASYSARSQKLSYDWDLNGDGAFEIEGGASKISHTYATEGERLVQVRVRDEYNGSSTMSAQVIIHENTPRLVEIQQLNTNTLPDQTIQIDFKTDGEKVLVLLDEMPAGFVDPVDQRGNFILKSLTRDLTVTLVPYADGHRGIGRSVVAAKTVNLPEDQPKDDLDHQDQNPDSADKNTNQHPANSNNKPITTLVQNQTIDSNSSVTVTVPKAPDTGSYDAKKAAKLFKNRKVD